MDQEVLSQVGEIAKNISVAFDGKLNSETLVKIASEITPQIMGYLYFLQIKSLVVHVVWAGAVVISSIVIGRHLLKLCKEA